MPEPDYKRFQTHRTQLSSGVQRAKNHATPANPSRKVPLVPRRDHVTVLPFAWAQNLISSPSQTPADAGTRPPPRRALKSHCSYSVVADFCRVRTRARCLTLGTRLEWFLIAFPGLLPSPAAMCSRHSVIFVDHSARESSLLRARGESSTKTRTNLRTHLPAIALPAQYQAGWLLLQCRVCTGARRLTLGMRLERFLVAFAGLLP